MPQTWNQSFLQETLYLLVKNLILRPKSGPSGSLLLQDWSLFLHIFNDWSWEIKKWINICMFNKLLIFTNIYQYETSYTFIQLLPVPTHDCRICAYLFYITFFVSFMYCIYFYLVSSTLRIVSQGTVNIRIRIFYITFCFISHHSHNNLSMECDFTLDIWLLTEFKLHFSFFPSSLMSA